MKVPAHFPGTPNKKGEREMKGHVSRNLVWLCLVVAFSLTLASAASAQPGEFVKGVLQPLADGFPKRAITIIVVDDPGTRDGIYARTFQEELKPMSPVPILVSDEPVAVGGTFDKLKDLHTREGGLDGYYPVVIDVFGAASDPLVEPLERELGLDITDLHMVTITESLALVILQRKNAPWGKTFAGMVKWAKENPGKLRYSAAGVGSGTDIACSMILAHAGILDKVKKIPAQNIRSADPVVGAGEADFSLSSMESALAHLQSGRVDCTLFTTAVPPPYDKDPNIVSMKDAGLPNVLLGHILGMGVPKQVPKAHVDWLYKLFRAGALTDFHKKRETTFPGLKINVLDPEQSNAAKMEMYKMGEPIVRELGLHWEEKK
jgi:tripartite-type tricarboxylate transporter receptor subunit TctC